MNNDTGTSSKCPGQYGTMPSCAPLAAGYVPVQQTGSPRYSQGEALSSGTLYPGLNLPFHLKVQGSTVPESALSELQALEFVILELGTYLDTHPDDGEAFALFKQYVEMDQSARAAYEKANGPLTRKGAAQDGSYTWLRDPWPWNYTEGGK